MSAAPAFYTAPEGPPPSRLLLAETVLQVDRPVLLLCQQLLDASATRNDAPAAAPYPNVSEESVPFPSDKDLDASSDIDSASEEDSEADEDDASSEAGSVSSLSSLSSVSSAASATNPEPVPAAARKRSADDSAAAGPSRKRVRFEDYTGVIPEEGGTVGTHYNLGEVFKELGIPEAEFASLQRYVKREARDRCNEDLCLSSQDDEIIEAIKQDAIAKFVRLKKFDACWPVKDLLLSHLKYTSGQYRKRAKAAAKAAKAARAKAGKATRKAKGKAKAKAKGPMTTRMCTRSK